MNRNVLVGWMLMISMGVFVESQALGGSGCGGPGQVCCADPGSISDCCVEDPFCVPFSCASCDCDSGTVNVAGICCDPVCDPVCGGNVCNPGCPLACNPVTCPGNAVCNASCSPPIPPACNPVCPGGDACGSTCNAVCELVCPQYDPCECEGECSLLCDPLAPVCNPNCGAPADAPLCNPACGGNPCNAGCPTVCDPVLCPDNAICGAACNPPIAPACNPICPGGDLCGPTCQPECELTCPQYNACQCEGECSLLCDPLAPICNDNCGGDSCNPVCPSFTAECDPSCGDEGQGPCFCFDGVLCCESGLGQDPPVIGECSKCYIDNPGFMCNNDGRGQEGETSWLLAGAEDLRTGPGFLCDRGLIRNPASDTCENVTRHLSDVNAFQSSWTARALEFQREIQGDLPLTQGLFLGSHNSYNNQADAYVSHQHTYSMSDQLDMGLRFLMPDIHWFNGELRLCHGDADNIVCSPFDRPWRHAVEELQAWSIANPLELIIVKVENATNSEDEVEEFFPPLQDYFGNAGWILTPSDLDMFFQGDWTNVTPNMLRELGKRLIVTSGQGGWGDDQDIVHRDNFPEVPGWPGNSVNAFLESYQYGTTEPDFAAFMQFEGDTLFLPGAPGEDPLWNGPADIGFFDPSVVRAMVKAGVNQLGIEPIGLSAASLIGLEEPFDDLMQAAVWSWAENEPVDASGRRAARLVIEGDEGRFRSADPNEIRRFACQRDTGGCWTVSTATGTFDDGDAICQAEGRWWRFRTPGNGYEMQQLADKVIATLGDGGSVWVNYRDDIGSGSWTPAVTARATPSAFPEKLARNTTGIDASVYLGAPDDTHVDIGGQSITYDFDLLRVVDRDGAPDFNVYEVDFGGPEFDAIDVLVSANGVAFYSVKDTEGPVASLSGDEAHSNDAFARSYDIAATGLERIRYIRIRGLSGGSAGGDSGFDLDAVGALKTELVTCDTPIGDITREGIVDLRDFQAFTHCVEQVDFQTDPSAAGLNPGCLTDPCGQNCPLSCTPACPNSFCSSSCGGPCSSPSCPGYNLCDCVAGGDPCNLFCDPLFECNEACGGDTCNSELCPGYECECVFGGDPGAPACGGGEALTPFDCLAAFDFDANGVVDFADYAGMQRNFTVPGK